MVVAEAAQTELERNTYRYGNEVTKFHAFGGLDLGLGAFKQAPESVPAEIKAIMDHQVVTARSLPVNAEKFFQLDASLSREFQRLIKQLREEQSLRRPSA